MQNITLHIEGMSCGHCLNAVNQALNSIPGVKPRSVQMGRAEVEFDPATASADAITEAVTRAGYKAAAVQE
ncbi:MAG: heavy-metal-associated domain-containing protein [Gemmatimonadales bacterium]